jgi:hypothetical protein
LKLRRKGREAPQNSGVFLLLPLPTIQQWEASGKQLARFSPENHASRTITANTLCHLASGNTNGPAVLALRLAF